MNFNYKSVVSFLVILMICFSVFILGKASQAEEIKKKKAGLNEHALMYEEVRKLISELYIDQDFNHQDLEIWSLNRRYKDKIKTYQDSEVAIETMLSSLGDRYTRFLNKKEFKEEIQAIKAELTGIGVQIGLNKEDQVIVISPIQGTPGFKAGLLPRDRILEVDGDSTKGLSVEEVANKIRGKIDTKVELLIKRGEEKEKKVKITRAKIKIDSIPEGHHRKLGKQVCYIHLTTFIAQDAALEFSKKLKALEPCKGLVLDLRNNPGGLLENAVLISGIFLEEKQKVVSIVDRSGYIVKTHRVTKKNLLPKFTNKVVVLVNGNSASASEIFSGALRDNGRAPLVGETTFGKGLVQQIESLEKDRGGLNVTTHKYYTPGYHDIHKLGIEPDYLVKVEKPEEEGPWFIYLDKIADKNLELLKTNDKQLLKAIKLIEKEISTESN